MRLAHHVVPDFDATPAAINHLFRGGVCGAMERQVVASECAVILGPDTKGPGITATPSDSFVFEPPEMPSFRRPSLR